MHTDPQQHGGRFITSIIVVIVLAQGLIDCNSHAHRGPPTASLALVAAFFLTLYAFPVASQAQQAAPIEIDKILF